MTGHLQVWVGLVSMKRIFHRITDGGMSQLVFLRKSGIAGGGSGRDCTSSFRSPGGDARVLLSFLGSSSYQSSEASEPIGFVSSRGELDSVLEPAGRGQKQEKPLVHGVLLNSPPAPGRVCVCGGGLLLLSSHLTCRMCVSVRLPLSTN